MIQSPSRTWQVAFYIALVPACLLVLAIPRLLCFVAKPWMLTVWERTRLSSKNYDQLLAEHQANITGINEIDARRLQKAKDVARHIQERRCLPSESFEICRICVTILLSTCHANIHVSFSLTVVGLLHLLAGEPELTFFMSIFTCVGQLSPSIEPHGPCGPLKSFWNLLL